jgi:hypothetical protein
VDHDSIDPTVLDRVSEVFARATSALFITGAGISADSGLPTYRGIGGLYEDATTEEGIAIEDALSGDMLRERPEVCWKYIHQIERACRGATWNRAHEVLALMEGRYERTWVLTQNVDGFHRRAGSKNVIEIPGGRAVRRDAAGRRGRGARARAPPRLRPRGVDRHDQRVPLHRRAGRARSPLGLRHGRDQPGHHRRLARDRASHPEPGGGRARRDLAAPGGRAGIADQVLSL